MLSHMIVLATQRQDGQFDKGGKPYILHQLKVMHHLKTDDEQLMAIAVGHDLIEDTFGTDELSRRQGLQFLTARGFSSRITQAIDNLTKRDGESHEDYKRRVMSHPDSIKVKMADLRHNSDILRLKNKVITEKDVTRTREYHEFYLELEAAL